MPPRSLADVFVRLGSHRARSRSDRVRLDDAWLDVVAAGEVDGAVAAGRLAYTGVVAVEVAGDEVVGLDARGRDPVRRHDHREHLQHFERGEVCAEGEDVLPGTEMVVGGESLDVAWVIEEAVALNDVGRVELI